MQLALAFLTTALANPIDQDGDGYPRNAQPPQIPDCNDTSASVSPSRLEVIGDNVDQDCDGHDAGRRILAVEKFDGGAWTLNGAQVVSDGDVLSIGSGGSAYLPLSIANPRGQLHLAVDVEGVQGAGCTASLAVSPSSGAQATVTRPITSGGTSVLSFASAPPPSRVVTRLTFACAAGSTLQLDWSNLQNVPDILLPALGEIDSADWKDLNTASGGLVMGSTRAAWLPNDELVLISGSDNGGVGVKYVDAGLPWNNANGFGEDGLADLSVWDVAGIEADGNTAQFELFALAGLHEGQEVRSALWYSADEGDTWEVLADSLNDGVGMAARETECGISDIAAGQYLVPDPDIRTLLGLGGYSLAMENTFVWVASNYFHTYWDLDGLVTPDRDFGVFAFSQRIGAVCDDRVASASASQLPSDRFIGAIARAGDAEPYLLVGLRAGVYMEGDEPPPSLYACALPTNGGGFVDLTCGDLAALECVPVEGSEGIDVTDMEVNPLDPEVVYLSDGGDDPAKTPDGEWVGGEDGCKSGRSGAVYELALGGLVLSDVSPPEWSGVDTGDYGVSGVSVEPDGDYLFAFLPGMDSNLMDSPIWRVETAATSAATWTKLFDAAPADDKTAWLTRAANTTYSGTYWENDRELTPMAFPAIYSPKLPIDAFFYEQVVDTEVAQHAVVLSGTYMWDTVGLDDASADYYESVTWELWPEASVFEHHDFQSMGGREIALAPDGNLWVGAQDNGIYMIPAPSMMWSPATGGLFPPWGWHAPERDCLLELSASGSQSVSVGEDGAIWAALHDQTGSGIPHRTGVIRIVPDELNDDEDLDLWRWTFMGAGVPDSEAWRDSDNSLRCRGYTLDAADEPEAAAHYAANVGATHRAVPMDGAGKGFQFTEDEEGDPSPALTSASWGSARSVRAVDRHIAVVMFESYTYTPDPNDGSGFTMPGRLAYTLNEGASWTTVPFGATTTCTDEYGFYERARNLSLVGVGSASGWRDTNGDGDFDGSADEWSLDVLIASPNAKDANVNSACNLARVTISSTDADGAWQWYVLPHASGAASSAECRVGGLNLGGVVASPWSSQAFIWGSYLRYGVAFDAPVEWGGACAVRLDSAPGSPVVERVTSPATRWGAGLGVADVQPDPTTSGQLLVATVRNPTECQETYILEVEARGSAVDRCPTHAWPLLVQWTGSAWNAEPVPDSPAGLLGSSSAWTGYPANWIGAPTFYFAATSGGLWRATLEW